MVSYTHEWTKQQFRARFGLTRYRNYVTFYVCAECTCDNTNLLKYVINSHIGKIGINF